MEKSGVGPKSLSGKTCLITGASRGLGRSIATRFWSEGASLVLAVREPQSVATVVADLERSAEQRLVPVALDLLDVESVRSLVPRTIDRGVERVDVLVNNAGVVGPMGKTWECAPQDWADAISADLVSPALICSAVVPWMARFAGGRIINLSGGGATGPRPNFSAYAAAKAGFVRFSETLAEETKPLGISVNCVAPGPMGTNMLAIVERAGAERVGEKEYVAARKAREAGDESMRAAIELIAFLASDRSDGITGKLISAIWDNWGELSDHLPQLGSSDVFTIRRITGRDRGITWCDK